MKRLFLISALAVFVFGCASKQATSSKPNSGPTATTTAPQTPAPIEHKMAKADSETTSKDRIICKLDSDERLIEIVKTASGGCEVKYTKQGKTSSAASSAKGSSHCKHVSDKIKSNLTKTGYSCE